MVAFALCGQSAPAQQLVGRDVAARHGLVRAWFAQIPVDPARSRVTTWYLYFDQLYGVTDSGIVTALDSETGAQLWTKRVGRPGAEAFGPGANDKYLGVVSGAKLYLLERRTGRTVWVRQLGNAPSSGPALSEKYAFVALMTGRIEAYDLEDPATQPWYYQSKGRTFLRPTATGSIVSWPTTAGYLYVSRANDPGVLFRLETNDDIVTSPSQQSPYLFIASLDGYLYAIHESSGAELWRYSTGYSITSSPAVVGDTAYVASFQPALHAVDIAAGKGTARWVAPGVSHFAARGKDRVYAADRFGNLLILDAKTGARQGRIDVAEGMSTLVNNQTDRIYLVNDHGLVQCLREIGAEQPTRYREPIGKPTATKEDASKKKPPAGDAPAADEAPDAAPRDNGSPFVAGDDFGAAPGEPTEPDDAPLDEPMEEPLFNDNPFE
jgi:outer membrane protein assembly factor BamB